MRLKFDANGKITAIDSPTRISPPDSRNTCGWFSPDNKFLIFASTAGKEDPRSSALDPAAVPVDQVAQRRRRDSDRAEQVADEIVPAPADHVGLVAEAVAAVGQPGGVRDRRRHCRMGNGPGLGGWLGARPDQR